MPPRAAPTDVREWVSFEDPDEERTWLFDATFLESNWACIYGHGCQGVLTEPAPELVHGCCSYGAHFVDQADLRRVQKAAKGLGTDEWQFRQRARTGIAKTNRHAEQITRLVNGACIFLNRPGSPTGPGCALHQAALRRGRKPLELKPEVCWQLPLRREDTVADDGHVTSTVSRWDRRHWGAGGQEFHWWCTEPTDAFAGRRPVYEEMEDELTAMVGKRIYRLLRRLLESRAPDRALAVPVPYPTARHGSGPTPRARRPD